MFSGNTARRLEESGGVTSRPWVGQQQLMTFAGHEPHRLASEAGQTAARLSAKLLNQPKQTAQIL